MEFLYRDPLSVDWATMLFVLTLTVIVVTRNAFPVRFSEFIRLGISNKYLSVYRDANNIKSGFTISMFVVQMISLSFFVHYLLSLFGHSPLDSFIAFTRVFSVLVFFILIKYFIEKIIAVCFGIEEFVEQYNLVKVTYRSFLGLILFPLAALLFYNHFLPNYLLWGTLVMFVLTNIALFILLLKNHQNSLRQFILYFILYLCTFEIAPYIILYHWFVIS
ncbi:MAG TPA: DUF4271 domain-containing protein [Flavobacterium sp.]|nr:DUF4271 domain-containing protein [Flavobacterium sp.]